MSIGIILALCFFGLVLLAWLLINWSLHGFNRYQAVFTENTGQKLENLYLFVDTKKVFLFNVAAWLLAPLLVYLTTRSIFYLVMVTVVLISIPKFLWYRLETRRKAQFIEALPDALAQIAGGMSAGQTFVSALEGMVKESKGPISQEFSLVLREQRLGKSLSEAMENLGERIMAEELDLVIAATQIANEVGGNLSEIFHRLSTTLRQKMEMEGKIKALTSQGILQGWVVGLLPFFIMVALYFVDQQNISPIFSNLLGWIFLGVIFINEAIGGLMIRKIVTIDI
ncbi:MAG: type II secretion system F family protein [Candidatus Thiodiazotropha sp.]|jgi:tight adherence protein B